MTTSSADFCARYGIDFPLFAFSHCRDVVAAVSNAGGFGVLGGAAYSPERLDQELTWIDQHVNGKPYGIDIIVPAKFEGKGETLSTDDLASRIPESYRDFVNKLLVESGEYNTFAQNDLGVSVTMNSHLALKAGWQARHNSDVAPDRKRTDTLTTMNVVYRFK